MTVKPSNSHVGTTCPKEAAKWGTAASIWPLGEEGVEFAWLQDGGIFWPVKENDLNKMKRTIVTSSMEKGAIMKNSELADALREDAWEIMFRADDGFLAVPAELDEDLRTHLMNVQ